MDETKLTREVIIKEALLLLNEAGPQGLSMRRLAARVGVRAPSLYWYFPDKAALIAAMIEVLFERSVPRPLVSQDWREWMRQFGRAMWRVHCDAPQAALLIMSADLAEDSFNRNAARIAEVLETLNGNNDDLMQLQSSVQSLMTGWSAFAHARYGGKIGNLFDVEQAAFRGLDALISGWKADETH